MWHYRLAKREDKDGTLWGVVEYYKDHGYTDSIIGWFDDKEEVVWTLKMMLEDIESHKVLEYKGIEDRDKVSI